MLSHVQLFATPRTLAYEIPLSMGFFQARILEPVAISYSRDLPDPGLEPAFPALVDRFFTTEPPGKPSFQFKLVTFQEPNSDTWPLPLLLNKHSPRSQAHNDC